MEIKRVNSVLQIRPYQEKQQRVTKCIIKEWSSDLWVLSDVNNKHIAKEEKTHTSVWDCSWGENTIYDNRQFEKT